MRQSGGQQADQTSNFFWILIGIMIVLMVAWVYGHQQITRFLFAIRHYELLILIQIVSYINVVAHWLHLPTINFQEANQLQHFIDNSDPATVSFDSVSFISTQIGMWLRYPIALILVGLGAYLYFSQGSRGYRNIYNMKELRKFESENWPQIDPIIKLDLVKEDIEKGPWSMAQMPLDFCKAHNLLRVGEENHKPCWEIKKEQSYSLFVMQLGPVWKGPFALPIHMQALLVIFITKALRQHEVAQKLISQIAESSKTGKLNFEGVKELLYKYYSSKLLQWLQPRHAYVFTLMMRLLEIARGSGVLATAEFLWLKPLDRRLWFALNTVGRRTASVEVAGIYAHWLAEKKLGRGFKTPMVDQAVMALEVAVKEILYVREGEKWHPNEG